MSEAIQTAVTRAEVELAMHSDAHPAIACRIDSDELVARGV